MRVVGTTSRQPIVRYSRVALCLPSRRGCRARENTQTPRTTSLKRSPAARGHAPANSVMKNDEKLRCGPASKSSEN